MQIPITTEDVIKAQRLKIGELTHDLVMAGIVQEKLIEQLGRYETADAGTEAATEAPADRPPAVSQARSGQREQTADHAARGPDEGLHGHGGNPHH